MTASPTQPGASTAMQLRAGLWLLLALAVTLVCTAQFATAGRVPLQPNLLALLPPTERNPLAEEAVRRLADAAGDRAVFLVGAAEPAAAAAAARAFAATLRGSDAFRQVIADIPAFDPGQLTALYVQHRFSLLAAADRAALAQLPNVRLLEPSEDIDQIFAQTRVLLAPSLWDEAFGRIGERPRACQ